MKISRILLAGAALAATLLAQTPEERKRFQEIQQRRNRGEQINAEDMAFAKNMVARQNANNAAWAAQHPAQDSTGLVALPDLGKGMYKGFEGGLYPGGVN